MAFSDQSAFLNLQKRVSCTKLVLRMTKKLLMLALVISNAMRSFSWKAALPLPSCLRATRRSLSILIAPGSFRVGLTVNRAPPRGSLALALASSSSSSSSSKVTPSEDVLKRIKYDTTLDEKDFRVGIFDRITSSVDIVDFDQPNETVAGSSRNLVFAVPSHRISSIYYKEKLVWAKEKKVDLSDSLQKVMRDYDQWEKERGEARRKLEGDVTYLEGEIVRDVAERETWDSIKVGMCDLEEAMRRGGETFKKVELEKFVREAAGKLSDATLLLKYLEAVVRLEEITKPHSQSEHLSALYLEAESLLQFPSEGKGKKATAVGSVEQLAEEDIVEKNVRGTGPGGQKINKTSSKVSLLHVPTGVRVECQKTRSLHQNRKIARRLLAEKVDEHKNGRGSKTSIKGDALRAKKKKNKARASRRRKVKKNICENDSAESC